MRIFSAFLLLVFSVVSQGFSQPRSFSEIFPGVAPEIREAIFSSEGYYRTFINAPYSALIGSARNSIDPQILEILSRAQPGFMVESIQVISGAHTLLDVYNALGRTRGLAGRLYHSYTRDALIPLFEEVTRIESARRHTAIPDPLPASSVPSSETVYLRLRDANFGNSFYRGEMALSRYGLRFSLSNFRNLTYLFFPVIREGMFIAQLYFEPIAEGLLIYGLAGADVSNFVSSRVHIPSAISKRLEVIMSWVTDEIMQR